MGAARSRPARPEALKFLMLDTSLDVCEAESMSEPLEDVDPELAEIELGVDGEVDAPEVDDNSAAPSTEN